MLGRFSLYDFIAVVIPGIFFLWAVGNLADISILKSSIPLSGGIAETSVLIIVGYVTGLMLQGISQQITEQVLKWWWGGFPSARWLLPEDHRFSHKYKEELATALQIKFGILLLLDPSQQETKEASFKRNQEIFYRCYRSIEKLSDLPQTFNAQYGLFRSLLTTFVLLVIVAAWKAVRLSYEKGFDLVAVLVCVIAIIGVIISYGRVTKKGEDFAKSVYDIFLANFAGDRQE